MATGEKIVYSGWDWEIYTVSRPMYPAKLFEIIYDYHASHGGQHSRALDIGAGNGIITKELLNKFDHVTYSDVYPPNVEQAKERFAAAGDRVSFATRGFSDLSLEALPHGQHVDLVTAGTCVHFSTPTELIPTVSALLRPGGTLAFFTYSGHARYPANEPGFQEFEAIWDKFIQLWRAVPGASSGPEEIMNSGMDSFPFSPSQWQDVRRMFTLSGPRLREGGPMGQSGVDTTTGNEKVEQFEDTHFISKIAGYDWIRDYCVNIYPGLNMEVTAEAEFEALKKAMGDKQVEIIWPFDLVLASRKE